MKLTPTEKKMIFAVFVFFMLLCVWWHFTVKMLSSLGKEIHNNGGIKAVVDKAWFGNKQEGTDNGFSK